MYSMDCISLGVVIAWAMECYEKGVITQKDTYGLDLTWGNADALVEITKKIGERAEGSGLSPGRGMQDRFGSTRQRVGGLGRPDERARDRRS